MQNQPFEWVTHSDRPAPLPEPSYQARAFMPEDKPDPLTIEPDDALQAWSNRLQARFAPGGDL